MPDAQLCRFIKATSISLKVNFKKSESLCLSSNKSHYPIPTVLKISPKVLVINTLSHGTEHTLYGVILGTLCRSLNKAYYYIYTVLKISPKVHVLMMTPSPTVSNTHYTGRYWELCLIRLRNLLSNLAQSETLRVLWAEKFPCKCILRQKSIETGTK